MECPPMSRTRVVLAGPDRGLIRVFEDAGASVTHVSGVITAERLDEAGIEAADLFVLTDAGEATSIPIVREVNDAARIVAYTPDSLPEFALAGLDLALDPALFEPEVLAEELLE